MDMKNDQSSELTSTFSSFSCSDLTTDFSLASIDQTSSKRNADQNSPSYLNNQPLSCTSQVSALTISSNPNPVMTSSNISTMMGKNGAKSPHCKVCGDESSGFHYGVDSCEGCKGFFRRCITQGMTHKCSNEEKCDITPFTRNSCQYCRLKKCFAVGMSREASRLGRRPKRMKDPSGKEKPTTNLPIAPYPANQDVNKGRLQELQGFLQQGGTLKPEMMEAFLSAAQVSFREHQRTHNTTNNNNTNVMNNTTVNTINTTKPHGQRAGNDSGYSSLSSPSSNKSSSPPQENQQICSIDGENNVEESKKSLNVDSNMLGMCIPTTTQYSVDIKPEPTERLTSCSKTGAHNAVMDFCPQDLDVFNQNSLADIQESGFDVNFDSRYSSPSELELSTLYTEQRDEGMTIPSAIEEMFEDNTFAIDVDKILTEVKKKPSDIRRNLIDQVTEEVVGAHFKTCKPTYQNVREANARFEKLKSQNLLPDFSKMKVDPSKMWDQYVQNMVPEITLVVKFCKQIPVYVKLSQERWLLASKNLFGFDEICQEDQINLIKQGSFEVMLVRMCNLVDIEKEEIFDPDMKMKCPKALVLEMPLGTFMVEFFKVAKSFNPLQLTDGEIGLFTAALIICPDRKNIKNSVAIMKLQLLLLQSLYVLIKKNHSDFDTLFVDLMNRIPMFRGINAKHAMELNNMKMHSPESMNMFPDLHKEVFMDNAK